MSDKVYRRKLRDLIPDSKNANKGTVRGLAMLEDSIRQNGIGRGVLIDRNNEIIGGNKTVQELVDLGFEDVLIVPTDGKTLVATQRVDVDIDTPQGRALAIADNRVAEIDLAWSAEELAALQSDGVDLSAFFDQDELDALLAGITEPTADDWMTMFDGHTSGLDDTLQITFVVPKTEAPTIKEAIAKLGGDKNAALIAMAKRCLE